MPPFLTGTETGDSLLAGVAPAFLSTDWRHWRLALPLAPFGLLEKPLLNFLFAVALIYRL